MLRIVVISIVIAGITLAVVHYFYGDDKSAIWQLLIAVFFGLVSLYSLKQLEMADDQEKAIFEYYQEKRKIHTKRGEDE